MNAKDLASYERKLRARRTELLQRLRRIETDLDAPKPRDDEDRAIELEDDEVLEDLGHSGETELRAIDAALGRVADGSYGICQTCGGTISKARLDVVPTTAVCRGCAE